MKKLLIALGIIVALGFVVQTSEAGTLDRGARISSFFIVGGSWGNITEPQLKYQMAVDARLGLRDRYVGRQYNYSTVNTTYDGSTFTTTESNSGTFNTFDTTLSGGYGDVIINNTTSPTVP